VRALRDFLLAPPPRTGAGGETVDAHGGVPAPALEDGGVRASPAGDPALEGGGVTAPPLDGADARWRRLASAARPLRRTPWIAVRESAAAPHAIALLCAPDDAVALGVAAAALTARRARAPCALVCVWTGRQPRRRPESRAPASRAARRLAAALATRGLDATPRARAVVVALPIEPAEAVAATARAVAASGSNPTVVVLAGPRPVCFDDLLAGQDRVLVLTRPGTDAKVASLAVAGIPVTGGPVTAHPVGLGPAARALAAAGLMAPAAVRRALDPARPP
jgi:hypothetical protein